MTSTGLDSALTVIGQPGANCMEGGLQSAPTGKFVDEAGVVGGKYVLQQLVHDPPLQAQCIAVQLCLHRNLHGAARNEQKAPAGSLQDKGSKI